MLRQTTETKGYIVGYTRRDAEKEAVEDSGGQSKKGRSQEPFRATVRRSHKSLKRKMSQFWTFRKSKKKGAKQMKGGVRRNLREGVSIESIDG
jgi:hypothetical protein